MTEDLIGPVLEHYGATVPSPVHGWTALRCPFHDDRMASASVNYEGNAFCCHTCGVKGDVYAVVMEREGCTFADSLRIVEDITGIRSERFRDDAVRRPSLPDGAGYLRGQGSILETRCRPLPDKR